jgi:hypothetical protein
VAELRGEILAKEAAVEALLRRINETSAETFYFFTSCSQRRSSVLEDLQRRVETVGGVGGCGFDALRCRRHWRRQKGSGRLLWGS